ncbi:hypothetical protein KAU43_06340 [candidate division WOR-3 bacterium]|nr:hypothetical protein [candidate division WOR-3 bacterium]
MKCEDCGNQIGRELTPEEKQEKFEKEMAEKIKAQRELGHCGSVGGGLNFVCEMDENHIGKCRVFSKQDGSIIAEWDNSESEQLWKHGKTVILEVKYKGQYGCENAEQVIIKVELKETQTLDDLYCAIISQAFKWDDLCHLYSFFFDNKAYSDNSEMVYAYDIHNMFSENNWNPSSTPLNKLNLKIRQRFLFVYDFGDDHRFDIKVKKFGECQEGISYPNVLEGTDNYPVQYHNINGEKEK